jgi:hypothetical protein
VFEPVQGEQRELQPTLAVVPTPAKTDPFLRRKWLQGLPGVLNFGSWLDLLPGVVPNVRIGRDRYLLTSSRLAAHSHFAAIIEARLAHRLWEKGALIDVVPGFGTGFGDLEHPVIEVEEALHVLEPSIR